MKTRVNSQDRFNINQSSQQESKEVEIAPILTQTTLKPSRNSPDNKTKISLKPYKSLSIETNLPVQNFFQEAASSSSHSPWRKISPSRRQVSTSTHIPLINQTIQSHVEIQNTISQLSQALFVSQSKLQLCSQQLKTATLQTKFLKDRMQQFQKQNQRLRKSYQSSGKLNITSDQLENLQNQLGKYMKTSKQLQRQITIQKQMNDILRTKSNQKELLEQIDSSLHELGKQRKEAEYYQEKYEELRNNRDKKRKERDHKHKEEMATLSAEILRMNDELYSLKTHKNTQHSQINTSTDRKDKILNILQRIQQNTKIDQQLLHTVNSKYTNRKRQYSSLSHLTNIGKQIICSINQIKTLTLKSDNRLANLLKQIQEKMQYILDNIM